MRSGLLIQQRTRVGPEAYLFPGAGDDAAPRKEACRERLAAHGAGHRAPARRRVQQRPARGAEHGGQGAGLRAAFEKDGAGTHRSFL
jgi:hypothetical protein